MELGLVVPAGLSPSAAVRLAVAAEEIGLSSFWVPEGHGGDAFALLAAASLATSRIRLGSAVVNVYSRSATTIAMAAVTLAELSAGRFTLGIGTSHDEQMLSEHGLIRQRPMETIADVVEVARRLQRDQLLGELKLGTTRVERFALDFAPRSHHIPIYLAAVRPKMMKLSMRIADGAIVVWRTTSEIAVLGADRPLGWALAAIIHCAVGRRRRDCELALSDARQQSSQYRNYRALFESQEQHAGICCTDAASLNAGLLAHQTAGVDEALLRPLPAAGSSAEQATCRLLAVLRSSPIAS